MANEFRWETFEKEESLSPPLIIDDEKRCFESKKEMPKSQKAEDFEFQSGVSFEMDLCAADEVFFQGVLLPLKPSLVSDVGLFSSSRDLFSTSQESSKCGSRSDSMGRYSSTTASLGSDRSISSRSSSCISCMSRSHSGKSFSSSASEPPRSSVSNKFYAQPSPSPQIISSTKKRNAAWKTTGPWWGFFRLDLMKTPQIELDDLKSWKTTAGKSNLETPKGKKAVAGHDGEIGTMCAKLSDECKSPSKLVEVPKRAPKFFVRGLSCKCSSDYVDTISSRISITKKTREEALRSRSRHTIYHNRTFEWLEELSLAKDSEA